MSNDIEVVEVSTPAQAEMAAGFFNSVWQDDHDVVPFDLILAALHVGGYATMARHNDTIVGASFGFRGSYASQSVLHSHVTASTRPGAGYVLKRHQFNWAKQHGIPAITWTFDPLVRRNCVFNFEKLQAYAVKYLPNVYGTMTDAINSGDDSDRLLAYWPTHSPANASPTPRTTEVALKNVSGEPKVFPVDSQEAFWVELPEDIETLRKSNLDLVKQWRNEVRSILQPKLDAGWTIHTMNPERTAIMLESKGIQFQSEVSK